MARFHKYIPIVVIAALAVVVSLLFEMRSDVLHLKRMIEHLDEEVDEAKSGVERLLKRGSPGGGNVSASQARAVAKEIEYDFGKINKKDGAVKTTFTISNTGEEDLLFGEITTSCGCTSAELDRLILAPKESAVLTVNFDPNFHEEPEGRFSRSVFVPTNDLENPELEFKIFVEIIN
jgi:hypothetical protein